MYKNRKVTNYSSKNKDNENNRLYINYKTYKTIITIQMFDGTECMN